MSEVPLQLQLLVRASPRKHAKRLEIVPCSTMFYLYEDTLLKGCSPEFKF